jgi:hypothetical protein
MKILRVFFFCSSMVCLVSCTSFLPPLISFAHFSSPVNQSFKFDTNTAVVYGRFATGADFAFGNELALRLRNESSKREYLIRFRDKDSVCGIAVEPGQYRVAGFVATYMERRTVGRRTFPTAVLFEVRSNSITYLGDFTGYAKVGSWAQVWSVTGVTNNFVATTEEFRQKYPNFASVPVVSRFDQPPK